MTFELQIDIMRCVNLLAKRLWRIILVAMAAFLIAYAGTMNDTGNLYAATATVYSTAEGGSSLEFATQTTTAMQRYAEVARSLKVLNRAADLMGGQSVTGQALSGMVSISFTKDSSIMQIKAITPSPMLSVSAANAVAAAFVAEITTITGRSNAQVLDVAVNYSVAKSSSGSNWMYRALAVALAAGAYCAVVLLLDICTRRIHSLKSAGLGGEIEILGIIPSIKQTRRSRF